MAVVTGLVSQLLAPQGGQHAGWRWRGGQAMIPALLAQNLLNTIVLYHGTFGATCEFTPKLCYKWPMRFGLKNKSRTYGPSQ
jgi:hypothetical protein